MLIDLEVSDNLPLPTPFYHLMTSINGKHLMLHLLSTATQNISIQKLAQP